MAAEDLMPDAASMARIRAEVEAWEAERARAMRGIRWRVPVYLGLVLLGVIVLAVIFNAAADPREQWLSAPHVFLYVAGIVAAFFAWRAARRPAAELERSHRDRLLPIAFGFIDGLSYARGATPASFADLPREAVGDFDSQMFDEVVSGRRGGFTFELYEARLSRTGAGPDQSVFRGVVLALETEATFPGLLVGTRRSGAVSRFLRDMFGDSKLTDLESGVADLDDDYAFRSDNVAAAQPLVSGRLGRVLAWLREGWPKDPARVALRGDRAYLLLPHDKDFFALPDVNTPIDFEAHIRPIIADLASLIATGALIRKVNSPEEGTPGAAPASGTGSTA